MIIKFTFLDEIISLLNILNIRSYHESKLFNTGEKESWKHLSSTIMFPFYARDFVSS